MKKIDKWWPALLIIIAAMMWGIDGSVLRPALYTLLAKVVVFVEHIIAFAVMVIILVIIVRLLLGGKDPQVCIQDANAALLDNDYETAEIALKEALGNTKNKEFRRRQT